jgi:hypothetical protein
MMVVDIRRVLVLASPLLVAGVVVGLVSVGPPSAATDLWTDRHDSALDDLPEVDTFADAELSPFSAAATVDELTHKADLVVLATVESEEGRDTAATQERQSGTHTQGYATYVIRPNRVVKSGTMADGSARARPFV